MAEQDSQSTKDDPRQANEAGDAKESGRSRGRVVDEKNPQGPSRTDPDKAGDKEKDGGEDWESGRHRAN